MFWAIEGLQRLIRNNYKFTVSERSEDNLRQAMERGNNIIGFLHSEDHFEIREGVRCKSADFYECYKRWCLDNMEKPFAAATFLHYMRENQKEIGIVYDPKCIGDCRGFINLDLHPFVPVKGPTPFDREGD